MSQNYTNPGFIPFIHADECAIASARIYQLA